MRHRKSGRKLGKSPTHRKAMLANMATSLIMHERIQTTTAKAKELRRVVEPLITLGKKGGEHARRRASRKVKNTEALDKLFGVLAERYEERTGGYTRVIKIMRRRGDSAPISIIELVDSQEASVAEDIQDDETDIPEEEEAESIDEELEESDDE